MPIPSLTISDITDALKYIDENDIPSQHQSAKYELVTADGKKYPPKYVIAVADHLANGVEISTNGFKDVEAKSFLQELGFSIEAKQEKYTLTITSDNISSTDVRFTMNSLDLGNKYKPLSAVFVKEDGTTITRNYFKGEQRISNMTMPRIACQVFEKQLINLSVDEKEVFPVCQYSPSDEIIRGIFPSVETFRKYKNTIEYMKYICGDGREFYIYCWNIFSTIVFVQECLKRFGNPQDKFVLTYREKDDIEKEEEAIPVQETKISTGYRNPLSNLLIQSKNLILRGAPGTGKSYLAREIAADIVSDGYYDSWAQLNPEQKQQVEFVQFHPGYDYSDFVEGLRPIINLDGTMGFELQDGIFKKFITRARKNYEDYFKPKADFEKEFSVQNAISDFLSNVELGKDIFTTIGGNEFTITSVDDRHVSVYIPNNPTVKTLSLSVDDIRQMLESGQKFEKIKDITAFFGKTYGTQAYSYEFALYKEIKKKISSSKKAKATPTQLKNYVFIIDEINRGEISKIFGEMFFAIDPPYRGKSGEVSTQYSNLHANPDEKFYIPDNVYIIGTMNDIDRSVETFDFAMRRRFRFYELLADEHVEMLSSLDNEELEADAIKRMSALNQEILKVEDLNRNYQIGAAYFMKLKTLTFDDLWTDFLHPLLQEYIHGMYEEDSIMKRFAKAYGYNPSTGE